MDDQQDKPLYDEEKMRLMQEKINRAKSNKNSRSTLWTLMIVAVIIASIAVKFFPRAMLPIGGFLVCPAQTELTVTRGEKQQVTDSEGNKSTTTPVYLNCARGGQVVQALGDDARYEITLIYSAFLYLMMLLTRVIIHVYRRRNADIFEPPLPPV